MIYRLNKYQFVLRVLVTKTATRSTLDRWNRLWSCPNLLVTDGASSG